MELVFKAIHLLQFYLIPLILVLGVMIFFHELGHFLVAKHFGVKVLKFALGFGPVLVAKTFGGTEYSIRYFPLGGFVKLLGEEIENEDDSPELTPEEMEQSFSNKHPLKRIAIVCAGPIFNLVLALLIFCLSFMISGVDVLLPEVGKVAENSPALAAGFMEGDLITTIGGEKIKGWPEIKDRIKDKSGTPVIVSVKRGDQLVNLTVVPEQTTVKNEFNEEVKTSLIGIVASGKTGKIDLSPWLSIEEGFKETYKWIIMTFVVVGKLFRGLISINTLGGPILIGQMTGQIAQENIGYLIPFMAIISINLGILNLFPIPILDGGLIVFLLIELIIGKPLSLKKREWAMKIGLALLILLMLTVTYNDILRIINK
jgi:regulator of sigma E protease